MSGVLEHSPADIVGQALLDLGEVADPVGTGSWPLGISEDLPQPDNMVSIFDTQGKMQGSTQPTGEQQTQEGIMIRVRSRNHKTGFTKAHALAIVLDETIIYDTVTIESKSYRIHSINRTSDVIPVGKETGASKRHLFTINATVALTQLN